MKSFDEYAKSGALTAAVGKATRDAGLAAQELGLPSTSLTKGPSIDAGIAARALDLPPNVPIKVPSFIVSALFNPPVRKSPHTGGHSENEYR